MPRDKQTTFRVDALTIEQQFEGTDLGDQIVFTTQLLKGDTEVGHQGGACTVTSVQRSATRRSAWRRTRSPAGRSPARR